MRRIKNNRPGFSFWKAGAIFYVIFILEGGIVPKKKAEVKTSAFIISLIISYPENIVCADVQ